MIDINYRPGPGEFDIRRYWLDRGQRYWSEDRLRTESAKRQEDLIVATVARFNPNAILELGCGYGRITKALAAAYPGAIINAMDISPDQIVYAEEYCSALTNALFYVGDVSTRLLLPSDIAIAIELFLHYPTDEAASIIKRILNVAPILIHEIEREWKETDRTCCHVFWHDYEEIYRSLASIEYISTDEHALLIARRL